MQKIIPLSERRLDLAFIIFFAINIGFITYIVDIEQLTVADPSHFTYPLWPPKPLVDMVHWWGRNFDPPLMAREPWWRATIWLDVLGFGPFYAFAIYAFVKGRSFIRVPAFVWAGVMFANVTIILFEELLGTHKTPAPGIVVAANLPWLIMPWLVVARLARSPHPFAREEAAS
jgi:emopamil binding protein